MEQLDTIFNNYWSKVDHNKNHYDATKSEITELQQRLVEKQAELSTLDSELRLLPQTLYSNIFEEVKRSADSLLERSITYQLSLDALSRAGDLSEEKGVVQIYESTDNQLIRSSLKDTYKAAKKKIEESNYSEELKEPVMAGVVVHQTDNENAQLYVTVSYDEQMKGFFGSLTEAVSEAVLMSRVEFEESSVDDFLSINVMGNIDDLVEKLKSREPTHFEDANVVYTIFCLCRFRQ